MKKIITRLGSIELNEKVIITDPCYEADYHFYNEIITDMKPGTYDCYMNTVELKDWGRRVTDIFIVHVDYLDVKPSYRLVSRHIGVDSAQAGIFSYDYFVEHQQNNDWYDTVCSITDNHAGIIDNSGVVSMSGYGDGLYSLYSMRKDRKTIALKLKFI